MKNFRNTLCALGLLLPLAGCTRDHTFQPVDMWNGTRLKPYEALDTPNGTNALQIPVGAVARGQLVTDKNELLLTGKQDGKLATSFPFAVDEKVLQRGQQRYTIFCAPCHGSLGDGKGLIVDRGFSKPPDYIERRLMDAPVGHYFNVITHGHGAMYSYAARIPVNDRWAIAAYIRMLQKARARGAKVGPLLKGGGVYSDFQPYLPDTGEHGGDHSPQGGHGDAGNGHEMDAKHGAAPASGAKHE